MIKLPRFVYEFANYQIDFVMNCELMQDKVKAEKIRKIDNLVFYCRVGDITINETMEQLSTI